MGAMLRISQALRAAKPAPPQPLASTADTPMNRAGGQGIDWNRYGGTRGFRGAPELTRDLGIDPSTVIPENYVAPEPAQAPPSGDWTRAGYRPTPSPHLAPPSGGGAWGRSGWRQQAPEELAPPPPPQQVNLGRAPVDWAKYGGVRNHNPMADALRAAPSSGDGNAVPTV